MGFTNTSLTFWHELLISPSLDRSSSRKFPPRCPPKGMKTHKRSRIEICEYIFTSQSLINRNGCNPFFVFFYFIFLTSTFTNHSPLRKAKSNQLTSDVRGSKKRNDFIGKTTLNKMYTETKTPMQMLNYDREPFILISRSNTSSFFIKF